VAAPFQAWGWGFTACQAEEIQPPSRLNKLGLDVGGAVGVVSVMRELLNWDDGLVDLNNEGWAARIPP